jgi:hypothetical protein
LLQSEIFPEQISVCRDKKVSEFLQRQSIGSVDVVCLKGSFLSLEFSKETMIKRIIKSIIKFINLIIEKKKIIL